MSLVPRAISRSAIVLFTIALLLAGVVGLGKPASVAHATSAQPVLVVVSNAATANPFSLYLGELLLAEAILAFDTVELSNLDSAKLTAAKLVLLPELSLTAGQAALINTYIAGQGKLIAMRPDPQIQSALCVAQSGSSINGGYVTIDTSLPSGAGFTALTMPFHGAAARYQPLPGATTIATLCGCPNSQTDYPAVVRSGNTAAWAYDPVRSIIYTRQGNPANINRTIPGVAAIRTFGLFYQAIDTQRVNFPYADIQMRLLSRLIVDMLAEQMPLPRLWYFPNAKRTMLILTGDSHGNYASYFQTLIDRVENYGVRITIYLTRYGSH